MSAQNVCLKQEVHICFSYHPFLLNSPPPTHLIKVKVSFDASEARVSTNMDMRLGVSWTNSSNLMPGTHTMYYLAVDKSIILLEGSSELNRNKVSRSDHVLCVNFRWVYFCLYVNIWRVKQAAYSIDKIYRKMIIIV